MINLGCLRNVVVNSYIYMSRAEYNSYCVMHCAVQLYIRKQQSFLNYNTFHNRDEKNIQFKKNTKKTDSSQLS